MSNHAINRIWKHSQARGSELLVLIYLADRANADNICWPSVRRIGQAANLSERQVQTHLRRLEQKGEVLVFPGCGRGNASTYLVCAGLSRDELRACLRTGPMRGMPVARQALRKASPAGQPPEQQGNPAPALASPPIEQAGGGMEPVSDFPENRKKAQMWGTFFQNSGISKGALRGANDEALPRKDELALSQKALPSAPQSLLKSSKQKADEAKARAAADQQLPGTSRNRPSGGRFAPHLQPHPAILIYQCQTGRPPPDESCGDLVAVVGDDPSMLKIWERLVEEWVQSGWNPHNVAGLLVYFRAESDPTGEMSEQLSNEMDRIWQEEGGR